MSREVPPIARFGICSTRFVKIGTTAITPKKMEPTSVIVVKTFGNIIRGRTARPDTGDKAAILFHVVGHLYGIELNRRIEVGEKDNQYKIQDGIDPGIRSKYSREPAPEARCLLRHPKESRNCAREGHN